MAKLRFAKEKTSNNSVELQSYKILIVDDEQAIHDVTNMVLSSMNFSDFKLEVINAYSGEEAKEIIKEHDDIALAFVDVVMETPDAGLNLVTFIRKALNNSLMRVVIRTGQANDFPEMEVIRHFDINDFKHKTELTVERLFTTIRTSIKQYIHLVELENKYQETYKQMTTNSLTRLSNRIKLYEDCEKQSNQTLIMIDLVGFSTINENNGYDVGDYVLKEIAGFLQSMYGDDFNIYHLDSDVFALVSKEHTIDNIVSIVQKIKDDIEHLHLVTNNFNQTIDTTIGVAYQAEENIIRKAELALKEARNNGKNNIQFYSDDLKIIQKLDNINHWGPIIKEALSNGSMFPYAQPIYDLETNQIEKFELLIRLSHAGEVHAPFKFLGAAKHSGQMYDIFKFMFTHACAKAQETGMRFSVNIGDSEFENNDIVEFIENTINTFGVESQQLSLEILEYNSITGAVATKDKIIKIAKLGVKIIIDDFGINCSNFGQLEGLPVDTLKIDGSFIQNLPNSQDSQLIVQAIQTFTNGKKINVVAEFISSQEILEIVKGLGIKYGQGFYLSEPVEDIKTLL